jgi:hypothetical protein
LTSLMRHGNHRREKTRKGKTNDICRAHEESQQKLLDSEKPSDEGGGVSPADDLRSDAPTLAQFLQHTKEARQEPLSALTRKISKSQGHVEHPYPPADQAVLRARTSCKHAVMFCRRKMPDF